MSADGTRIGYRRLGLGPSVILLHGGVNASQHRMKLAPAPPTRTRCTYPTAEVEG